MHDNIVTKRRLSLLWHHQTPKLVNVTCVLFSFDTFKMFPLSFEPNFSTLFDTKALNPNTKLLNHHRIPDYNLWEVFKNSIELHLLVFFHLIHVY